RDEYFGREAGRDAIETRRRDADDRERPIADVNRSSDHGWFAAEVTLPGEVTDDRHRRVAGSVCPSGGRTHVERRKELTGRFQDVCRDQLTGLTSPIHVCPIEVPSKHALEYRHSRPDFAEDWIGERRTAEEHEAIRTVDRQTTECESVEQPEYTRGRAHAEGD